MSDNVPVDDDDTLDGCELDFAEAASDDDPELTALFAEALDPSNPKTVEQVAAEWQAVFNGA
jgi:hypothetical protein